MCRLIFSKKICNPSSRFLSRVQFHNWSCLKSPSAMCSKTGMMDYKFSCWTSSYASNWMKILLYEELHIAQQAQLYRMNPRVQRCWTEILGDNCHFYCFWKFLNVQNFITSVEVVENAHWRLRLHSQLQRQIVRVLKGIHSWDVRMCCHHWKDRDGYGDHTFSKILIFLQLVCSFLQNF